MNEPRYKEKRWISIDISRHNRVDWNRIALDVFNLVCSRIEIYLWLNIIWFLAFVEYFRGGCIWKWSSKRSKNHSLIRVKLWALLLCVIYDSLLWLNGFHLFTQDSGQIIPLIVESCIRFINLYGKPSFLNFFFFL